MNHKSIRIVFMGTPDFAVGILKTLVEQQYNVVGVVTVADKPSGRGKQITESAVKKYALAQQIPVLQPLNLKNEQFLTDLKALQPDLQIVVAFRMLPKSVWQLPLLGTFNLHASLLPQYRGAAPINWVLINGETHTGVTTFFIDDKIDTGAIILQSKIPITPQDNAGTLHDKLMSLGSDLVIQTVNQIAEQNITTVPQPEVAPSLAPKLFKENCKINWSLPINSIHNFIKGLSPYPAAWTHFIDNNVKAEFKIFEAHIELSNHNFTTGKIITTKSEIKLALPEGFLVIDELQLPARKKMDAKSLLNGYKFTHEAYVL